jgi:hypothetical protein
MISLPIVHFFVSCIHGVMAHIKINLSHASAVFLLVLLFNPEVGGNILFELSLSYMVIPPRSPYSLLESVSIKSQILPYLAV